ncbi:class A beta-lactamase [Terribacillus halophilus]|uniref:class A beta-lactamase n=1 Tax=Terribacillus halophilus TaxID=361279 RepID=UPI00211983C3|nr:class A beta-lactamase [Terribacillus halophilus]
MKTLSYIASAFFIFCILAGCSSSSRFEDVSMTATQAPAVNTDAFSQLEETYDARLGIFAIDTGSGETIAYREDERFGFASTHKALSVGVLLLQNSVENLNKKISITSDDLVNYNPITEKNVNTQMTLKELSEASISYSDNAAANLIFAEIGGPKGFEQGLRAVGDQVTDSSRIEPELNHVKPNQIQDTSTPKAMTESLRAFTLEDHLSSEKRQLLIKWLKGNTTGDTLIRAGVPADWEVGDKSGAGSNGIRNDIAILWPPDKEPIVLSIMSSRDKAGEEYDDSLISKATEEVITLLSENE